MVPRKKQSKGISLAAVQVMRQLGLEHGLKTLIAPVSPSKKHLYPLISMDDYISWKNEKGEHFDPWLRVHARLRAEIVKVCSESMRIPGTIRQWEDWTGLKFFQSGSYVIPGALNPIEVDIDSGQALYIEPNVWLVHR